MDPLSALSVASSVIQFVDFGCKLVSNTRQIYRSVDGVLSDKVLVEVLALDLASLSTNLRNSLRESQQFNSIHQEEYSEDDKALDDLCRRCHSLAMQLIIRLDKLKVQGSSTHRNWESFKKALRASWSHEEMDSLASQLNELRSEIQFRTLLSFRESIKALATHQACASHQLTQSTKTIINTFVSIRDEFSNELQRQVEKLAELQGLKERRETDKHGTFQTLRHQDDESEDGTPISHEISAKEIQLEQEMMLLMTENGILGSLEFPGILDRHEDVEIAHNQTFEWIYRDSTIRDKSWSNFVEWLKCDMSFYWVNGKAGSGKSTLMKYIYDNKRTREELKNWAGMSECYMSGFFFWNSGTEEQRSQRGLLRTLLFETLQSHRDLLPDVLPNAWDAWSARVRTAIKLGTVPSKASFLAHEPKPWTLSDLKRAFQTLIRKCQSLDIKLCLFIDGLDEYDGDHDGIVDYLLGFDHEPGIKMCFSSRPLVVFEEAFAEFPGLKLQNLTHGDVSCYVEDQLGGHRYMARLSLKRPEQARHLVTEIVTKANGVFLWVKLVVKSLLQGLRDQNRISDLEKRLRHLPADLEALYEHMLQRTDPFYFEQASQIFQIVLVAQKESSSRQITLLQLSWAEDEDESAAINTSLRALAEEEIAGRCKLMDSRLKSVCSGLLESYDSKYSSIAPDGRVVFLHRTVSDFFNKPSVWEKITKHTQGTSCCPHLSLLRSCILQLKALKVDHSTPLDMSIIRDALSYAKKAEDSLRVGFPALLDQLDAAASYQWRMSGGNGRCGRVENEKNDLEHLEDKPEPSKQQMMSRPQGIASLEPEADLDDRFDNFSVKITSPSIQQYRNPVSQTQPIRGQPSTLSKSIAIRAGHGIEMRDFRCSPIEEGALHQWTYGIEFPGVKPFNKVIPFYDLAQGLALEHYVAHKNASGLVVDHDVNHHILMHAVTSHSGKIVRSLAPDPVIINHALEAGADSNFSFHGSTPWEEALTSVLAHLSLNELDGEMRHSNNAQGQQWEADAKIWAEIMKTFLQHGADPVALSKYHWGQPRQKPLAILQKFPDSLANEAEELKSMIRASLVKSTPKLENEDLHGEETAGVSQRPMDPEAALQEEVCNQDIPVAVTAYKWFFSWLSVN